MKPRLILLAVLLMAIFNLVSCSSSNSPSSPPTNTPVPPTNTPTLTPINTATSTASPTKTPTPTFTNLSTNTGTPTPTLTRTNSATSTATNSPTVTSTATITNTPTGTLPPTPVPGMYWGSATIQRFNSLGSVSTNASVLLTVNGQPLTTVNVVVTGSALSTPVTIPYSQPLTYSGVAYANYFCTCAGLNYQPGQTYTFTTTSGAYSAYSTETIPGGITIAADGSQTSWGTSANFAGVVVQNSTNTVVYSNYSPTNPQSIPATAYAGGGVFNIQTYVSNTNYSVTGGTISAGNGFKVEDVLVSAVTVATPTPTSTTTDTPTATATNSFTPSPTSTATSTPTNSLTPTPTQLWRTLGTAGFSVGQPLYNTISASTGAVYFAYTDAGNSYKATVDQYVSGWSPVGTTASSSTVYYLSFALGPSTLYTAWEDGSTQFPVVRDYSSSWANLGTTPSVAVSETSIDYDSIGGQPWLAYCDEANSNKATVLKYGGSSWATVGTPDFSPGAVQDLTLKMYNGAPYVAYADMANGGYASVMYYNGSAWQNLGPAAFSAGPVSFLALALDSSSGTPYVAYSDQSTTPAGKLTVMKYSTGSWTNVGSTGISAGVANNPSLVISGGTPWVVFQDLANSGHLSVLNYTGSAWVYVGPAGFTTGSGIYPSIDVNFQVPYVGFSDGANSGKATVMYFQ